MDNHCLTTPLFYEDTTYLTLYAGECLQDKGIGRGIILRLTKRLNVWKPKIKKDLKD